MSFAEQSRAEYSAAQRNIPQASLQAARRSRWASFPTDTACHTATITITGQQPKKTQQPQQPGKAHTHTHRERDRQREREGETGTDKGRLKETLLLLGSCLFD